MTIKSILVATACLSVLSFAAIPEMKITTKDNKDVLTVCSGMEMMGMCMGTTTKSYFNITNFQLTGHSTRNSKPDSIKVRGNSTANAAKKPYKIKFGEKVSLFNKEPAKSWVLLANFYDATFALNSMAFELGKRLGLEFTPTSQHVDLHINNQYKGIYQLTEQIQSNKGRVDIREKHNGWLVEFDYHDPEQDERLSYFKTSKYDLGTFIKAPELDEMENPRDSTQLRFVKTDLNNLVNKMAENGFPNNGYRDLIDLESFAKYVLIQLVMDNSDFNSKFQDGGLPGSNYAYKIDDCEKIKAGPLWDFDLAVVTKSSHPRHDYSKDNETITPTHAFYKKLWEDDVFKAKYKKAWIENKNHFQAMSNFIDSISNAVRGSVNNNTWNSGTLNTSTFDSEIANLKSWWTKRLNWVGQQIGSQLNGKDGQLGIDGSKDIAQSSNACNTRSSSSNNISSSSNKSSSSSSATTPILLSQTTIGNIHAQAKNNAIVLENLPNNAKIEVYNLQGKHIYSTNSENSQILRIPVLTKGMYIIRVRLGNSTSTYQNRIYLY